MKSLLAVALAAGALWTADTAPARADVYKWCAMYGGNAIEGSKGCWFVTREQCEATVSGLSGFCIPNTFGNDPEPRPHADHGKRAKKRAS
jgi:hypothetical protein